MRAAFFWILWGLICAWALKTFYYSFSKEKFAYLKKAVIGIHLSVLTLCFLPWLPPSLGEKSGLTLALEGNVLALLFIILLVVSLLLCVFKDIQLLKLAAIITITNTFLLFGIMYQLRPGTFTLTLFDIAPIVAFMNLLVGNAVVLLLWQQLQLKQHKKRQKT